MNAGQVQGLTCINVADANDNVRVHDEWLDTDAPAARFLPQIVSIKLVSKGFGAKFFQQPVMLRIGCPMQGSKSARVAKPQGLAGGEFDVHVIVDAGRGVVIDDGHTAGHAKVQNRCALVGIDEQILGTSGDRRDDLSWQVAINIV